MYVYTNIYIYYIYNEYITYTIYIYVVKKTKNVPSQLLAINQWPHDNSCTSAHDVHYV